MIVSVATSITVAKLPYSLSTTRKDRGNTAGLRGDTAAPVGRVPSERPAGRTSIHRETRPVAVSTTATRQSGTPALPGRGAYNFKPSAVSATASDQLRSGRRLSGHGASAPIAGR